MKVGIFFALVASVWMINSCTNELEIPQNEALGGGTSNLSISVLTGTIESKGLVTGTYLPSGTDIGVTVLNTSGGNYDGTAYNNIKFTSSGEDANQTWSGASTVTLSTTQGYCYAYYPYSPSASTITAIPVLAGGTDYLYATWQSVSNKNKNVILTMRHALSAIRFALKRGTYTGTGTVSNVSVTSSALGSSGTLNATTGAVTADNLGTAVAQSASFDLGNDAQNVDVVMVPSGTAGAITLSVTIDGKAYSTEVSSTTIEQGICYTYTLTVNAASLSLSGVKVGDWGYDNSGAPVITAGGYKVSFAGEYSGIGFENSVSGNSLTIKAYGLPTGLVNEVTVSGSATLTQSVINNVRTIIVSDITSDVTITFNGFDPMVGLNDGVYGVDDAGSLVDYATACTAADGIIKGVAFVVKGKVYQVAKADTPGNDHNKTVYWDSQQLDSPLTNFTSLDGTNNSGYLAGTSGTQLARNPYDWTDGALNDFNGKENTDIIIAFHSNGTRNYTLGNEVIKFRNDANNNEGHNDWFVPSLGELAAMFLLIDQLNSLLAKIGGDTLSASNWFYSSTECGAGAAWGVTFWNSDGRVSVCSTNQGGVARFIRLL